MKTKERLVRACKDPIIKRRMAKWFGITLMINYSCSRCGEIRGSEYSVYRAPCPCGGIFYPLK